MQSLKIVIAFVLAAALSPGLLQAQVASGPTAGTKVEALKVAVATGDLAGKDVDFAEERQGKSTIFIFVQADKWDRPIARFLKTLDQTLAKDRTDIQIIAVWLTDDAAKSKDYVPKAQESLKLSQTTFTVYPGDKGGPNGWGINADAHATTIVVQDQKVTASFGYRSVNETDVPAVLKELKPAK